MMTEFEPRYQLVDAIPEVAAARQDVRDEAWAMLEHRRLAQQQGREIEYLQVDALSTAHEVLSAYHEFGEGSAEHKQRSAGLVLDCQRLVGEWYRKQKPEYFAPTRHIFDATREEFFSHGLSIRQMTENALVPLRNNEEEESRRINERVEDATPHILRKLGKLAVGNESILTISECTDKAIADYAQDQREGAAHRGYDGYVPEIQKVMIRAIRPDTQSDDRFEEQIGLPGTFITHEIIQMALERRGIAASDMDKTALHGAQLLTTDDLMDFIKLLDEVASEQWCTDVFMGEEVPAGEIKDYDNFRQEALARQELLMDKAAIVATFVTDLAEDNVDRRQAPAMVEEFVKNMLLKVAVTDIKTNQDSTMAEQMFDAKTAEGLKEVAFLEAHGKHQEAFEMFQQVQEIAPGGGFCGAGSCGLENISLSGKAGTELKGKLKAEAGDEIVRDKVRACRCGSKSVVYAYNKNKVNKLCEGCGAFESKLSKVA